METTDMDFLSGWTSVRPAGFGGTGIRRTPAPPPRRHRRVGYWSANRTRGTSYPELHDAVRASRRRDPRVGTGTGARGRRRGARGRPDPLDGTARPRGAAGRHADVHRRARACERRCETWAERRLRLDPLARDPLLEREPCRVQELALEAELLRTSIDRIAGERKIDRREMDTDLVRPSRLEPYVQERMPREELHELEVRHSVARCVGVERVTKRIAPVASDRRLDPPAPRTRAADDEREIMPFELAPPDERQQTLVRLLGTGDDHQARRVPVEPVHDARPLGIAAREPAEQPVHERPAQMTRRGMHDDALRLFPDPPVPAFPDDPKWHLLRHERVVGRGRGG